MSSREILQLFRRRESMMRASIGLRLPEIASIAHRQTVGVSYTGCHKSQIIESLLSCEHADSLQSSMQAHRTFLWACKLKHEENDRARSL